MNKFLLIIVYLSLYICSFCQQYEAKLVKTTGVVITKYSVCSDGSYVEMGSKIRIQDSVYFFCKHRNGSIIHDNPYILDQLEGKIEDYDDVYILSRDIVNDLSKCPFDSMYFCITKGHFNVHARDGFYMKNNDTTNLFSAYIFEGTIILYQIKEHINTMKYHKQDNDIEESYMDDGCGCPKTENLASKIKFATLLQTDNVFSLNTELRVELQLEPVNIDLIHLVYCE